MTLLCRDSEAPTQKSSAATIGIIKVLMILSTMITPVSFSFHNDDHGTDLDYFCSH